MKTIRKLALNVEGLVHIKSHLRNVSYKRIKHLHPIHSSQTRFNETMEIIGLYFASLRDKKVMVDDATREGFVLLMTNLYGSDAEMRI